MNADVWERFQAGDEQAFRLLVEQHSPRLLALVYGWTRDRDHAEDLLQDAWIRIYTHRTRCTNRGAFLGWAMMICRNLMTDRFRSETARKQRQATFAQSSSDRGDALGYLSDSILDAVELDGRMKQELLALPDLQRDVVILRVLEGCSTQETAERLGRATGTVKASLHRALGTLKGKLQE